MAALVERGFGKQNSLKKLEIKIKSKDLPITWRLASAKLIVYKLQLTNLNPSKTNSLKICSVDSAWIQTLNKIRSLNSLDQFRSYILVCPV